MKRERINKKATAVPRRFDQTLCVEQTNYAAAFSGYAPLDLLKLHLKTSRITIDRHFRKLLAVQTNVSQR